MPILLTTPISPGDLDPGKSYTHLKIEIFGADLEHGRLSMTTSYGYTESGSFVRGAASPRNRYMITGPMFVTMLQSLPNVGETTYAAVARRLYEWMIAEGHAIGTIV